MTTVVDKFVDGILGIVDLGERMIGPMISPAAWEAVPTLRSTVVMLEADGTPVNPWTSAELSERLQRLADGVLPEPDKGPRRVMLAQCLTMIAPGDEPSEIHLRRFASVIAELLETKSIRGKICNPYWMPLATECYVDLGPPKTFPPRSLVCALLHFDEPGLDGEQARVKLNARVGFEAFTKEGQVPLAEWPPV